jgi:hypothetical protein
MRPVWYRVEDVQYASSLDEWERPSGDGEVELIVLALPIERETACGVWLDLGGGFRRFVLRNARKRYACPTRDEAFDSFRARKAKQRRILEAQLRRVAAALAQCPPGNGEVTVRLDPPDDDWTF